LCRPKCSFRPLSVRRRLGFSNPMLGAVDADCRNRWCLRRFPVPRLDALVTTCARWARLWWFWKTSQLPSCHSSYLCCSSTSRPHAAARASDSRVSSISTRDGCDECSLWAVAWVWWPSSMLGLPGPASCDCSPPIQWRAGHAGRGWRQGTAILCASKVSCWCAIGSSTLANADVTRPFWVWQLCVEVLVQQIGRDVEGVIALGGHLVFLCSFDADNILTHQTTDATMANVQTELFQFLCNSRPTLAAQAETWLFPDVRQNEQVTHSLGAGCIAVLFNEPNPHCFWPAKNCVAF